MTINEVWVGWKSDRREGSFSSLIGPIRLGGKAAKGRVGLDELEIDGLPRLGLALNEKRSASGGGRTTKNRSRSSSLRRQVQAISSVLCRSIALQRYDEQESRRVQRTSTLTKRNDLGVHVQQVD